MSEEQLEQFRRAVLESPALQARLRETPDRQSFVALMLRLGAEHGYQFTAAEVEGAISAARREWYERWL
jgi:predicted ribosomally synthesized peptide with nif11-like leader